jgi:NADP-dependent 3-hydroxy acid dehydrogenase YdfG
VAKRFQDKVVVVTGASAGVGRAIVRAFAEEGARIGLIARSEDGLEAAAREVQGRGGTPYIQRLDVADAGAVERAAQAIEEELGPIDIWVNNAMVTVLSPIVEMTPDEFKRVTEVTYLGYVYGTLSALKRMRQRDEGVIIQIGSALEYRSIPLQSAYCAAKAAIRGFNDSLRTELLHDGSNIKLTSLQLPAVNTPQFSWVRTRMEGHPMPVPPIFQPEMIADAVLWAAEHTPREMVIGGSALRAIAGQKVVPGLVDRYLARGGYESQQADFPVDRQRPDNLYDPVPGDFGAHGIFDDQSSTFSPQLVARTHLPLVAGVAAGIVAAAVSALALARSR